VRQFFSVNDNNLHLLSSMMAPPVLLAHKAVGFFRF
jgi:hypothetical protein